MAIKAKCDSCGTGFTAKAALAGKRVKCPKCKNPMTIPPATGGAQPSHKRTGQKRATGTKAAPVHNPLLDLLDEAGVESTPTGPVCESCGNEISPHAVICVNCGFNRETGRKLETAVFDDEDGGEYSTSGMTDAEKLMARAEKEIEDSPVTAVGQDFGDGADSIVIAGVSLVVLAIVVAIGIGIIFVMDQIGEKINSALISFFASIAIALACILWITIVAFLSKSTQGMICVCTLGLYCIVFGFTHGKLLLPTIILLLAILIGVASSFFAFKEQSAGLFSLLLA